MNELVIQTHNFEKAKNQLKQFSMTKPDELALKKVDVDGGLFNWFDHKVTGQELNALTNQIQGYLIKFNTLNTKFIKEFGEVYNALEALDKEYIQAILISIKAAEKASKEAKDAQKDINKTIEMQKQTILVLKNFKDKLDKYEHLENVDEVWKDTQKFAKELKSVYTEIASIKKTTDAQYNTLVTLNQFVGKVSKYKHLASIDLLWENSQTFSKNIKSVNTQIVDINNLIKVQGQEIEGFETI
ncbi:conserved oligomeric Golgi complex subunit 6 [Metabacillus endolithicus]|uniref:conserved oligomeric Golgi complex subunit 6 n=1 Tax=Metabacillus endolithicus TaxID=1535204 RepID=UPI001FFAAB5B|nr:conserved oligomeric Golgi complex subunit 6 [Metabacillus endolithicus]UPG61651.1 conserved oligomeric Golgi complex subunit 6 [Metabacillus endolithicus]